MGKVPSWVLRSYHQGKRGASRSFTRSPTPKNPTSQAVADLGRIGCRAPTRRVRAELAALFVATQKTSLCQGALRDFYSSYSSKNLLSNSKEIPLKTISFKWTSDKIMITTLIFNRNNSVSSPQGIYSPAVVHVLTLSLERVPDPPQRSSWWGIGKSSPSFVCENTTNLWLKPAPRNCWE